MFCAYHESSYNSKRFIISLIDGLILMLSLIYTRFKANSVHAWAARCAKLESKYNSDRFPVRLLEQDI